MEEKKKPGTIQDMLDNLRAIEDPNYKPREDGTEPPLYVMVVDAKQREHIVELLNPDTAYGVDVDFIEEWYEEESETEQEPGVYQTNLKIRSHLTNTPDEPEEWDSWTEWYNTKKYRLELPHEEI